MMFRTVFAASLLLLAVGCGPTWVNPTFSDSRAMSKAFDKASSYCKSQVEMQLPRIANNERDMGNNYIVDEVEDYDMDEQRQGLYESCLKSAGWVRK